MIQHHSAPGSTTARLRTTVAGTARHPSPPYLAFYVIGEDVVDVWRILHTKRDIPSAIASDIEH